MQPVKGGRTPIHIMRWAPADYVNDPAVKLALARRDLAASTFYPLFLFHAFMQGGSLPSDGRLLAATLGLTPSSCSRALNFWKEQGKITEKDGRLTQSRVAREVERELKFREEQAALGRLGGLAKSSRVAQGLPKGSPSPPSPSPAPLPAPAPIGTANPLIQGKRPSMEVEAYRLIREINALEPELDGTEILLEATSWQGRDGRTRSKVRIETLSDDHLIRTIHDLRRNLDASRSEHGTTDAKKQRA